MKHGRELFSKKMLANSNRQKVECIDVIWDDYLKFRIYRKKNS